MYVYTLEQNAQFADFNSIIYDVKMKSRKCVDLTIVGTARRVLLIFMKIIICLVWPDFHAYLQQ